MPNIGEILDGKIIKILKNGAIVKLPSGETGFLHISEVSSEFVKDINKELHVGQEVKVKLIYVNKKDKKMSLSIRRVDSTEEKRIRFEAKMNRFLKDSSEKQRAIQKNIESKQGIKKKKVIKKDNTR